MVIPYPGLDDSFRQHPKPEPAPSCIAVQLVPKPKKCCCCRSRALRNALESSRHPQCRLLSFNTPLSPNPRTQKLTMPEMIRRRVHSSPHECWHIYYGDIHVGTIAERTGLPNAVDRWSWSCGFYPLTHRGLKITGMSANLFRAWAAFDDAWDEYLPLCNERVFTEHRRKRVWTAWKQRMWNAGCRDANPERGWPLNLLLRRRDRHYRQRKARLCRPHGPAMRIRI